MMLFSAGFNYNLFADDKALFLADTNGKTIAKFNFPTTGPITFLCTCDDTGYIVQNGQLYSLNYEKLTLNNEKFSDVVSIASDIKYTFILTKDGKVLKNNSYNHISNLYEYTPLTINHHIIKVVSNPFGGMALTDKGLIYSWKNIPRTTETTIPTEVNNNNDKIVDIAANSYALYLASDNGKIYVAKTSDMQFQTIEFPSPVKIKSIKASHDRALVLTDDGQVFSLAAMGEITPERLNFDKAQAIDIGPHHIAVAGNYNYVMSPPPLLPSNLVPIVKEALDYKIKINDLTKPNFHKRLLNGFFQDASVVTQTDCQTTVEGKKLSYL